MLALMVKSDSSFAFVFVVALAVSQRIWPSLHPFHRSSAAFVPSMMLLTMQVQVQVQVQMLMLMLMLIQELECLLLTTTSSSPSLSLVVLKET